MLVPSSQITPVTIKNTLSYEINVYDSFSPAIKSTADNNYLGQLTLLGKIAPNAACDIQPMRSLSAFVIENAVNGQPLKRIIHLSFAKTVTPLIIQQTEVDAMTATISFIELVAKNPSDPLSIAFTAILKGSPLAWLGAMNAFFAKQSAYSHCSFETYMMAVAYLSKLPAPVSSSNPASVSAQTSSPVYSLSKLVSLMGGEWPAILPDIGVTEFSCNTQNGVLDINAQLDITTLPASSAQIAENFSSLFGEKTVMVRIQLNYGISVGFSGTRLAVILDTIKVPVGGGNSLSITQPTISIDINPIFAFVEFSISGIIPFNILNGSFNANISMTIDNAEASIQAVIDGNNNSLPAPPGMKGVHIDQFGVGIGVFFEPAGIALGVQGALHIGDSSSNIVKLDDDTFVLVCSIVEEVPVPVYLSFYVPSLTLNQVLEIFTNYKVNVDIPVNFSNLSMKWAQDPMQPITLPDGSLSQMGYGFSANVTVASFDFYGDVELNLSSGLTASIDMAPVNIGNVFTFSGDGAGVVIKVDTNGSPIKNNQIATTTAMQQAIKAATSKELVPPGGAVLTINTLSAPILHLNARASLFELENVAIEADINGDGILFELEFGGMIYGNMSCRLADFHNLYANVIFGFDTTIPLPQIPGLSTGFGTIILDTGINVHLSFTQTADNTQLIAGGSFTWNSHSYTFTDLNVDLQTKTLSDFLGIVLAKVRTEAGQLFAGLLSDAGQWANAAGQNFLKTSDAVADVLKVGFQRADYQVANVMNIARFQSSRVAREISQVFHLDATGVARAMEGGGYKANEVAGAIKDLFSPAQVVTALSSVFGLGKDAIQSTLQAAGYKAEDIANAFQSLGGKFVNVVSNVTSTVSNVASGAIHDIEDFNPF